LSRTARYVGSHQQQQPVYTGLERTSRRHAAKSAPGGTSGVPATVGGVTVYTGGTLFFNRSDAYSYAGNIYGSGTVTIAQGNHGTWLGTGLQYSLTTFGGTTNLQSGVVVMYRSV